MQNEVLMLRDSLFMAISTCAYALGTCLAQPGLLGICIAAAWQAKPLATSATKRSLKVLVDPGSRLLRWKRKRTQVSDLKRRASRSDTYWPGPLHRLIYKSWGKRSETFPSLRWVDSKRGETKCAHTWC
jgi:hypothetical protein